MIYSNDIFEFADECCEHPKEAKCCAQKITDRTESKSGEMFENSASGFNVGRFHLIIKFLYLIP